MTRTDPQLKIRLPQDLLDQLKREAKNSHRSLNAEIVYRLGGSSSWVEPEPKRKGTIAGKTASRYTWDPKDGHRHPPSRLFKDVSHLKDPVLYVYRFPSGYEFRRGIGERADVPDHLEAREIIWIDRPKGGAP